MAANNILPFSQDITALVQSQGVYVADGERAVGNQPGVARPEFVNKALKQINAIAVGLAQFIADNQGSAVEDTLSGAALSTMILNAIKSATAMPAGSIIWVPGTVAPAGTVKINGALLPRDTYARLWAYVQTSGNLAVSDAAWLTDFGKFSPGDGATNFRMPRVNGYAFRAWDDGAGVDSGRGIGTVQADQNLSHTHAVGDSGHNHAVSDPGHVHHLSITPTAESGSGNPWGSGGGADGAPFDFDVQLAGTGISVVSSFSGISIAANGGGEVRMKNIALMPVMFF
jgi:microcystin-dependent protein